jgi:hypothetical protein
MCLILNLDQNSRVYQIKPEKHYINETHSRCICNVISLLHSKMCNECLSPLVYTIHIHHTYTCIYHPYTPSIYMYIPPIYTIHLYVYTTHIHHPYTRIYHLIYTINIHVYTTHVHNQYTYIYTTHIHNQYTCIYHPYTSSIYITKDCDICRCKSRF